MGQVHPDSGSSPVVIYKWRQGSLSEPVATFSDPVDKKIKFQAFGKTKLVARKALKNKLDNKTQDEKDATIKQKETERVEHQIEKIKSKNQGRVGNVFRIRKDIVGPKKAGQEATSV